MSDGIHSCSYYCVRPACVLAQRDEMRERGFNRLPSDKVVMQQALDALEWYAECSVVAGKASDASNAIRAALAAPQSEPMAWAKRNGIKVVLTTCPPDDLDGWISLYAAPSGEEAGNGKS